MNNVVVTFEKNGKESIKKTRKEKRYNTPGCIEREENYRADLIETDVYLHSLAEKNLWYPMD